MREAPPRIAFRTFGCRLNQYETDMMRGRLEGAFEIVENDADVYLLNACTVTGLAERKARQAARRIRRGNPGCKIVLVGCLADAVAQEVTEFPGADVLAGNAWKTRIHEVVERTLQGAVGPLPPCDRLPVREEAIRGTAGRVRAFLKVQDGCARNCTYCRTTQVRGDPRSKPLRAIVDEATQLVASGIPEIVLTGIDLAQYQVNDGDLADAVAATAGIPGLARLRLASVNPSGITDALLDTMQKNGNVCRHFHIPLQSGDNGVLARMQRGYTVSQYREILGRIDSRLPDASFGTDIIVGFPGETDAAFEHTLDVIRRITFVNVHSFRFSPRPGTAAAAFTPRVPSAVAKSRSEVLLATWTSTCQTLLDKRIGSTQDVLVEERRAGRWRGYTSDYVFVTFPSDQSIPVGTECPVRITGRQGTQLEGVMNHRVQTD